MVTAAQIFSASIKSKEVERIFQRAPERAFPVVRDQTFRIIAGFRKRFMAANQAEIPKSRFPLLSDTPQNIQSGPRGGDAAKIFFVVSPGKGEAGTDLSSIRADVFSISKAWERLEEGGTFGPGPGKKKIPIPIGITLKSDGKVKSQWNTPERFTRANKAGKHKTLVAIKNPKRGTTILYWQKAVGRGKNRRFVYLPAYMLVDRVTQPRLLHFYRTWDAEQANRDKVAGEMLGKMVKAIENPKGGKRG